jgi:hypothetical protein
MMPERLFDTVLHIIAASHGFLFPTLRAPHGLVLVSAHLLIHNTMLNKISIPRRWGDHSNPWVDQPKVKVALEVQADEVKRLIMSRLMSERT